MGLLIFIVRLVLTILAMCFVGWVGYIMTLGLKDFFTGKKNKVNKK